VVQDVAQAGLVIGADSVPATGFTPTGFDHPAPLINNPVQNS
jgi:hypothetical protein